MPLVLAAGFLADPFNGAWRIWRGHMTASLLRGSARGKIPRWSTAGNWADRVDGPVRARRSTILTWKGEGEAQRPMLLHVPGGVVGYPARGRGQDGATSPTYELFQPRGRLRQFSRGGCHSATRRIGGRDANGSNRPSARIRCRRGRFLPAPFTVYWPDGFHRDMEVRPTAGGGDFDFRPPNHPGLIWTTRDELPRPRTSFPKTVKGVNLRPLFRPRSLWTLKSFRNFDRKTLPGFHRTRRSSSARVTNLFAGAHPARSATGAFVNPGPFSPWARARGLPQESSLRARDGFRWRIGWMKDVSCGRSAPGTREFNFKVQSSKVKS